MSNNFKRGNGNSQGNKQVHIKQEADTVRAALERLKPQLAMALPKHLTPERLVRITMTAVQNTPKLLECDRTSLFAAVTTCAQLGLEPDGVLGQAYLVPFGGKVQFIPGYKGYLTLARNSGEISSIQAHEVCANDKFEYAYGLDEKLHHIPAEGDRGEITHFYAYAKYKDGGHIFEVLTRAQVETIRDNSEGYKSALASKAAAEKNPSDAWKMKAYDSSPWVKHFEQMGRKTAIRRLANYLPMSVQRAAALDAAYDEGRHGHTDNYGDVVIDGEHEEINEQDVQQEGAKAATSKLDALAGEDEPQQDRAPRKTKDVKAPETKGRTAPTGTHWEGDELVDDETGEIVTGDYDKHGELVDYPSSAPSSNSKANGQHPQHDDEPGLFGAEG